MILSRLAFIGPVLVLAACATGSKLPADYQGAIRTKASPQVMALCISRETGVAQSDSTGGFVIDATSTPVARRYNVTEDKNGTSVVIVGAATAPHTTVTDPAARCAVSTAMQPSVMPD